MSFDLAVNIGKFRRLMEDRFEEGQNKKDIIEFISENIKRGEFTPRKGRYCDWCDYKEFLCPEFE